MLNFFFFFFFLFPLFFGLPQMTTPNMASVVALERALQNCSLNRSTTTTEDDGVGVDRSATLELNSHVALPYQWEQCLDLETGEIYYINWQNGTKSTEDPRKKSNFCGVEYNYAVEEEEEGNSYYDHDDYSSSSSSSSAASSPSTREKEDFGDHHVLVVAGCKSCLMYFMLPKRVIECPKCQGLLLHLDPLKKESL